VVDISQPCFVDSEYLTRWRPCATHIRARDKVRGAYWSPSGNVARWTNLGSVLKEVALGGPEAKYFGRVLPPAL